MITVAELVQELDREGSSTRRVLERVPEEHLDWRPHEKSLTQGQLAMHVATLPRVIAEMSTRPTFDADREIPRPGAESVAALLAVFDESLARAREVIAAMDDGDLASPWKMTRGDRVLMEMPRAALLRTVLFNHWYHHRGQLTVYLRQTGALVPAVYGDSADERPLAG